MDTSETEDMPEPLPAALAAMLELVRESKDPSHQRTWKEYAPMIGIILAYGSSVALFGVSAAGASPAVATLAPYAGLAPYLGAVGAMFFLHDIAEKRARRRLALLLEVIRGLQPR